MMVKGKAVEVEVVLVVAAAVEGRKLWLVICHRENLIALVMAAAAVMATTATVVILALVVIVEGLVMVSPRL